MGVFVFMKCLHKKIVMVKIMKIVSVLFYFFSEFCIVFMSKHTKAYIALVYICVIWGTTYLVMRIGVKHYPSFLFAGVRQLVAGLILIPAALFANKQKETFSKNILQQMLVGFLMLTVGNGLVSFGLRFIPSGVSALICSMMPVFAVVINLLSSKKDHFNTTIGVGLLLGICGVGLIFRHNIEDIANPAYLGGIAVTIVAASGWALGTVVNKRNTNQVNPFFNSGLQLFFGGIFMLIISPVVDNYNGLQLWNTDGIMCLVYLIIFGLQSYTAYMYSLSVLPVGIVTLYAYIKPLIAVIAGYLSLKKN